jgi:hypothetical protein
MELFNRGRTKDTSYSVTAGDVKKQILETGDLVTTSILKEQNWATDSTAIWYKVTWTKQEPLKQRNWW